MAKITLNSALQKMQGSIGGMVVRSTPSGQILSRYPDMSRVKWSQAQMAHRRKMKAAAAHYRKVMSDATAAARYAARAAKMGIPVSSLIMGEFLKSPPPATHRTST